MNKKLIFIVPVFLMACNLFQPAMPTATPGTLPTVTEMPPTQTAVLPSPTAVVLATVTPSEVPPTEIPPTAAPSATPGAVPLPTLVPGQPITITQIRMSDTAIGWGIGYQVMGESHILRTGDGGSSWVDVSPPAGDGLLSQPAALFQDAQSAWVAYPADAMQPAFVWRTSDGGASWVQAPLPAGNEAEFFSPAFFAADGTQLWLLVTVGAGMQHAYSDLFTSVDGGLSWTKIADPFSQQASDLMIFPHTGMVFKNATGWVTKENGVMDGMYWVTSPDSGLTWTAQTPSPPPGETNVMCSTTSPVLFDAQSGYLLTVCWNYQSDNLHAYFTAVNGSTVTYVPLPATVGGMQFFSPQHGLAFGCWDYNLPEAPTCNILSTTDGGQHWTHVKTVNWDGDFWFVNPQTGWAVARSGVQSALVRTDNGGATWQLLHPVVVAP